MLSDVKMKTALVVVSFCYIRYIFIEEKNWGAYHLHIHPGGNFRCEYSVLELVQTQTGTITKCTSTNWKVHKEKNKCTD